MKTLQEMCRHELETEFECYAAETGLDREGDYDYERDFEKWLEDHEIDLEKNNE